MESEKRPEILEESPPRVEQEPMAQPVEIPKVKKANIEKIKNAFKAENIANTFFVTLSLILIMYLAIYTRSSTLDSPTVLDYDPWFWFRRVEMIIENNMKIPSWDELSHYPPGRPFEPFQGWSYTIIIFYKVLQPLIGMTLTEVAKWSTLIMAAATVIPAFLLGKLLSNKFGGIATALFGVLSPALIGVSMAGYCDTDIPVVFYSFLTVYAIVLAIGKKPSIKAIPYYIFAILTNLLFAFSWGYGLIILLFFAGFIPAIFIFRMIEQIIHKRNFKVNVNDLKKETNIVIPLIVILVATNILTTFFGLGNIYNTSWLGVAFTQGKLLLVNISVAELQTLNILTREGFAAIAGRVGLGPVIFTLVLPILALYKIYKREEIEFVEIFLYIWAFITFFLITRGVRFSLLFSTATAVAAGYAIGNIPRYLKNKLVKSTFYGITLLLMLIFVSTAITAGYSGEGMQISNNWYNMLDWLKSNADPESLVVTWWDPGHIIAGYTGLRVHADGAHCGPDVCVPYNHDDRIQDMGRIFSISDEDESISILKKYKQLKPEQCAEIRQKFGDAVPENVCDEIPDMYLIASNDLIGKYYWMSYFGTGTGRNYFQMQLTNYDPNQGVLEYNGGQVRLVFNEDGWIPVLNFPEQGIRNAIIKDVVYFENGEERRFNFTDQTNVIDGMLWVDPSYQVAIFMDASIRDSVFTRMFFFNGDGLENFELVYTNPEIRLFRAIW